MNARLHFSLYSQELNRHRRSLRKLALGGLSMPEINQWRWSLVIFNSRPIRYIISDNPRVSLERLTFPGEQTQSQVKYQLSYIKSIPTSKYQ